MMIRMNGREQRGTGRLRRHEAAHDEVRHGCHEGSKRLQILTTENSGQNDKEF